MIAGGPPSAELPERDAPWPRFLWLLVAAAALLAVAALGSLSGAPEMPVAGLAPTTEAPTSVLVDAGCTACHAAGGGGTARAPGLAAAPARAAERIRAPDRTVAAKSVDEYLAAVVVDHCADPVPGFSCPDLGDLAVRLTADDVAGLVAAIHQLAGEAP
jgi:hypothetical protein